MEPIGLALKDIRVNHFTGKTNGELMIVHLCLHCGRISCNRIAGDDNPYAIINLLEKTNIFNKEIVAKLNNLGIKLLDIKNRQEVLIALYGYEYKKGD